MPVTAREARQFVTASLEEWGLAQQVENARLLVSELVTNAILHARSVLEIVLTHLGDRVRIDVVDGSPLVPVVRDASGLATGGRGMALVQSLADRWGVEPREDGKSVWIELDV